MVNGEKLEVRRESFIYFSAAGVLQRVYDTGVVRTPEDGRDEMVSAPATNRCNPLQLGHRFLRVLSAGSCQQNGFSRQRRAIQPHAA